VPCVAQAIKEFSEDSLVDRTVLEQVGITAEFTRFLRRHRGVVERYYRKYLRGAHVAALDGAMGSARDSSTLSREALEVRVCARVMVGRCCAGGVTVLVSMCVEAVAAIMSPGCGLYSCRRG
jgi:hypothetical protein